MFLLAGHWLFLLILRALPHVPGHDGVRLFLPAFGVLALLGGLGARSASRIGRADGPRWRIAAALLEGAASIAVMMPVPLSYFSPIVGGLPGATKLGHGADVLLGRTQPRGPALAGREHLARADDQSIESFRIRGCTCAGRASCRGDSHPLTRAYRNGSCFRTVPGRSRSGACSGGKWSPRVHRHEARRTFDLDFSVRRFGAVDWPARKSKRGKPQAGAARFA